MKELVGVLFENQPQSAMKTMRSAALRSHLVVARNHRRTFMREFDHHVAARFVDHFRVSAEFYGSNRTTTLGRSDFAASVASHALLQPPEEEAVPGGILLARSRLAPRVKQVHNNPDYSASFLSMLATFYLDELAASRFQNGLAANCG